MGKTLVAVAIIGLVIANVGRAEAQSAGQIVAPTVAPTVGNMQSDAIHNNAQQALDRNKKKSEGDKGKTTGAAGGTAQPAQTGSAPK